MGHAEYSFVVASTFKMGWMENANHKIAASAVGRWFQLDGSGHVSQSPFHDPGCITDKSLVLAS
jgi:hypothetical protein